MKARIYYGQDKDDGFIGMINLKHRYWDKWCSNGESSEFDTSETEETNSISIYHLEQYIKFIKNNY